MRATPPYRPFALRRTRLACATGLMFPLLATVSNAALAGPAQRPAAADRFVTTQQPERAPTLQELIDEASRRFSLPPAWVAEVMVVESRGRANALSPKGAIGLMQVMPETYAGLALRHGLGPDPWNPRDNVLAGAAYLRELFDRYGAPGFLVAYNAGPGRWDDYRLRARPLPAETIAYIARLGPVVGGSALPLPTLASAAALRSPLAAPSFITFDATPARVQVAATRARGVREFEAGPSAVMRADAIFIVRSRAINLQPGDAAVGDRTAGSASSRQPPMSMPAAIPLSPNELFPPRFGAGSRP